jgi:hypothetical protein
MGAVHTNTIEGSGRSSSGASSVPSHKVSCKDLTLRVAEFQLRYNNRRNLIFLDAVVLSICPKPSLDVQFEVWTSMPILNPTKTR